jgi:hypothetical protein
MKSWSPILTRIGICVALAIPMCLVEGGKSDRRGLGVAGYFILISLYWVIQAFTRFRNPLRGAVVIFALAILYWAAVPGWVQGRAMQPRPDSVFGSARNRGLFYVAGAAESNR